MSLQPETKLFEDCGVTTKGCLQILLDTIAWSCKYLLLCKHGISELEAHVGGHSLIIPDSSLFVLVDDALVLIPLVKLREVPPPQKEDTSKEVKCSVSLQSDASITLTVL